MNDNYIKLKVEYLKDIDSNAVLYSHKKTKTRVITIKCDDPNKAFCITFKTPPSNSKGIPHIIEHSVLSGSKKYPLKDPFNELIKTSVNTYLNAFTQADRTSFPVSSCNLKDFKNLTDVYLDAVFNPLIYSKEEIFLTEGWHYEIDDINAPLSINGVVYNEMKGAFSEPQTILYHEILKSLFPHTPYRYESGGDPKHISELSYQEFLDFHKKYYHPSNAIIFLYGDLDMDERLDYLDKEYLSKYDFAYVNSNISKEEGFNETSYTEKSYNVTKEEDLENEFFYTISYGLSDISFKDSLALSMLTAYLFSSENSIIKQRMVQEGVSTSFNGSISDYLRQSYISLIAHGANKDKFEQFKSIIAEELAKTVKNGINKDQLESVIDYYEFTSREDNQGTNKGINYFMDIMPDFIYNRKDPFAHLKTLEYYDILREELKTNYFDNLLLKHIINNKHKSIVVLKPILLDESEDLDKLKELKNSFSNDELKILVQKSKNLKKYQQTPNTKEALDTLPTLSIEDIDPNPHKFNIEKMGENIYLSEYFTKDIIYKKYLFKLIGCSKEDYQYLKVLTNLLGNIDTKDFNYKTIEDNELKYTGGISIYLNQLKLDNNKYDMYLVIDFSYQVQKANEANKIINSIVFNTQFNDISRIKDIISRNIKSQYQSLIRNAYLKSSNRCLSYTSEAHKIIDDIKGIDYYYFLKDIKDLLLNNQDLFIQKLENVYHKAFSKDVIIHLTCTKDNYDSDLENINNFKNNLSDSTTFGHVYEFSENILNEAFIAPLDISNVAFGRHIDDKFDLSVGLLDSYLSNGYLWNAIRIKGGAYGAFSQSNEFSGCIVATSYDDPNIANTIETFKHIPDVLKNDDITIEEFNQLKITYLATKTYHPEQLGAKALEIYLSGITYEERKENRRKVIDLSLEEFKNIYSLYNKVFSSDCLCVIGTKEDILNNKKYFKEIKKL